MTPHDPSSVPAPLGGYTNGLELPPGHRILFISGQIPVRADGSVPGAFDDQCRLVWDHIGAILKSAGMGYEHLVKVTTFLSDRKFADQNGAIRREKLGTHSPALTVIITGIYDKGWLLEIEGIAAAPSVPGA